ncbi:MAG: nickel-binding protein [Acidimicrobiia bacterium]
MAHHEEVRMSLFMDIHTIEGGVSASDVAGAHLRYFDTQGKYGVSYLRYGVDEEGGRSSVWLRRKLRTTQQQFTASPRSGCG